MTNAHEDDKAPLRLGIAGLGTVGAELVRQLHRDKKSLARRADRPIEMVAVSARTPKELGVELPFCENPLSLAERDDIDLVVEVMGGEGIAYELVQKALQSGKHVVTANKALLASRGLSLAKIASAQGVALNFEAAIASGVPIVKTLRESFCGDEIYQLKGILNGTSNYILCQMADLGVSFDEALQEAQDLGYAEADPSFDIYGDDAMHKLKLLIFLAFGVELENIPQQGIDKVEQLDIKMAQDLSYAIRLLAYAKHSDAGISASVEPVLVALGTKLSQSSGTENMIGIATNKRNLFLEGEGAGAAPTAASVVADIVDIARGFVLEPFGIGASGKFTRQAASVPDLPSAFYIRSFVADRAGSMAAMTNIMARHEISLSMINQPQPLREEKLAAAVFITHPVGREKLDKALASLAKLEQVVSAPLAIKIET